MISRLTSSNYESTFRGVAFFFDPLERLQSGEKSIISGLTSANHNRCRKHATGELVSG